MISIEKILGLAGVGSTIANVSILKRFLSGIVAVVAFTAVSSAMAGIFLMAALYGLYISLTHHGLEPVAAGLMAGGLGLAIVVGFAVMAVVRWYQLREIPQLLYMEVPIINRVSKLAEAFIDGLLTEPVRRE